MYQNSRNAPSDPAAGLEASRKYLPATLKRAAVSATSFCRSVTDLRRGVVLALQPVIPTKRRNNSYETRIETALVFIRLLDFRAPQQGLSRQRFSWICTSLFTAMVNNCHAGPATSGGRKLHTFIAQ
jgi:hypothetical protein